MVRGSQAAKFAFGPINRGLPTIQTTCNHTYVFAFGSFEKLCLREERRDLEKTMRFQACNPLGVVLLWPMAGGAFLTTGARRGLASGGGLRRCLGQP